MKRVFVLLLALLLALSLFCGCDARNGKVMNSPDVTLTPGNTPGHTPTVTDVPAPTATHMPSSAPDSGTSSSEEPPVTTPPTANTTGFHF